MLNNAIYIIVNNMSTMLLHRHFLLAPWEYGVVDPWMQQEGAAF